jgi:molecular chaperone GrpE
MSEHDTNRPDGIRVTDRRRVGPHAAPDAPGPEGVAAPDEGAATPATPATPSTDLPEDGATARSADPTTDPAGADAERARRQAAEYLEQLQRMTAEFDNARKRMVKDQTRAVEMASESLVARLLDVLDEFQIAMMHGEQAPEFAPYLKGFELVYAKLFDTLRAEGLERIDALGQPFDPNLHEALMQTGESEEHPVVTEVFRDGYTFKGRVLRPAGVKVHRGDD